VGQLVCSVIYRGQLKFDQLLRDIEQLATDPAPRRKFASRFAGRWHRPLRDDAFLAVAREVMSAGYDRDGLRYLERYASVAEGDPKYPQLLVDFGNALASKSKFNEALTQYMKVLKLKPEMASAYHNIGVVHEKSGRLARAIEHYQRALELDLELAKSHKQLAIAMLRHRRFDEASKHFAETVRLRPESATDLYNLAQSLSQQKRHFAAIKSYRRAIEIAPTLSKAHYQLGVLLDSRDDHQSAVKHLREAVRLQPDLVDAQKALGIALHRLGRSAEAIGPLSEVVRSRASDRIAHFNLALASEAAGQDQEALVSYRRVLEIDPEFASAQNKLAWVLATSEDASLRNGAEAVRWAEKVCRATQYRAPETLDSLAAAYAEAGNFDEAVTIVEKAMQLSQKRGSSELAEQIRGRLEMYRQGRAYRAK
jgi:tetratricopeptide (TPR) repeat protein